jgi:hypothetical protein
MPRGDFAREYWKYRKEGGNLSMKDYAASKKEGEQNANTNTI